MLQNQGIKERFNVAGRDSVGSFVLCKEMKIHTHTEKEDWRCE
jgi:hypothetical protein